MIDNNRLYAGAAIGLVAAAALGFGVAQMTQPAPPAMEAAAASSTRLPATGTSRSARTSHGW